MLRSTRSSLNALTSNRCLNEWGLIILTFTVNFEFFNEGLQNSNLPEIFNETDHMRTKFINRRVFFLHQLEISGQRSLLKFLLSFNHL
jgi:hypothetical protein